MGKIARLNFECNVAEDEKDFLTRSKGFVTTRVYTQLTKGHASLIVGRKGSGKTALRLGYVEHGKTLACPVQDISLDGLDQNQFFSHIKAVQNVCEVTPTILLRNIWRLFIGIRLMSAIRSSGAIGPAWSDPTHSAKLQHCKDFLELFESHKEIPHAGKITILHIAEYCRNHIDDFLKTSPAADIPDYFPTTKHYLDTERGLFEVLQAHKGAIVIFDDLDPWVERAPFDMVKAFAHGLIEAIRLLRATYEQMPVDVKCMLPTIVVDDPSFYNRDKKTQGYIPLRWNSPALKNMVARRIAIALNLRKHGQFIQDAENVLHQVFPDDMFVPDYWQRPLPPFNYIMLHSQYTPRDVLFCLQAIRNSALKRDADAGTFTRRDIYEGVSASTGEAALRVLNEYSLRCPHIGQIMAEFAGSSAALRYRDAVERIQGIATKSGSARSSDDAIEMLQLLYEAGFLGKYVQKKYHDQPASGKVNWKLQFSFAHSAPKFSQKDDLVIHPMFWNEYLIEPPREPITTISEPLA